MNGTHVAPGPGPARTGTTRRVALVAAGVLAVTGLGLLVHAALVGARFELVLVALGLAAGSAVIGLLALTPGLSVTRGDD